MTTDARADASTPTRARRIVALLLLAITVAGGLAVHVWLPESAASDIAGDALYAVAAYLAVVLIGPRLRPWQAGAIAAAWCTIVELLQLTGLPEQLGASFTPVMLVFGTVFDARDLIIYVVAVGAAVAVDVTLERATRTRPRGNAVP